jgi:hypothetical protein
VDVGLQSFVGDGAGGSHWVLFFSPGID